MKILTCGAGIAFAMLGFLLWGCSDEGTPGTVETGGPESQTVDLNDPEGGLLAVDEAYAFGDPALAAAGVEDETPNDCYAGLSLVQRERAAAIERTPRRVWFSLAAIWGDIRQQDAGDLEPPPHGEEVVWDGSMELSAGVIRLVNLIDFESDTDRILPRVRPERIEWVSVTQGFIDGLRVLLVIPADSLSTDVQTLYFKAGTYERTFTTTELEHLAEIVEISDTQKISFHAFRADPSAQVDGFCRGRWGWAAGDSVGRFAGTWVRADNGARVGFMRGHYGTNDLGEQVFFGKYIDNQGRFGGFLRGTWEAQVVGEEESAGLRENGSFTGDWIDARGNAVGHLQGRWTRRGENGGMFQGSWHGHLILP